MSHINAKDEDIRILTGHYDDIENLAKGVFTRPTQDGILFWSQDEFLRIRIDDNLQVNLVSEEWKDQNMVGRSDVQNSHMIENRLNENLEGLPDEHYSSLYQSINDITEEIINRTREKSDRAFLYPTAKIGKEVNYLIWKAIADKLRYMRKH